MTMLTMSDVDLMGKRVLMREDFNVPMHEGKITSDARIQAALPGIQKALKAGAAVILMSHLGRPVEGESDPHYSLGPVASHLSALLGQEVKFISAWKDGINVEPGDVVLLENVRFLNGETSNDDVLALRLASLCDVFVMDAFGSAHRAHASTQGVARYAPIACAGPLLEAEVKGLSKALNNPAKPMAAIVGGSKVSSKLTILRSLTSIVDILIVGGGIANTFIVAAGHKVGKSLYEPELVVEAKSLMDLCAKRGVKLPLPVDVVVGDRFTDTAVATIRNIDEVKDDELILDIGPKTVAQYIKLLEDAKTIIWNGPVGVFEMPQFAEGTKALAAAIAESQAYSIAGGGDTLSAIDKFKITDKISYISTGGGAFLEFLEGKILPGIAILEERYNALPHHMRG